MKVETKTPVKPDVVITLTSWIIMYVNRSWLFYIRRTT